MIRLDAFELDQLLQVAGFTDPAARQTAWAVAMRESRGTVDIVGGPNSDGSFDWGLFQINDVHSLDKTLDWRLILEGVYNAQVAFDWTDGGADWSTWGLGDTGWAGHLKRTDPAVWERIRAATAEQWEAYPAALAEAIELRKRPVVDMAQLVPGRRGDSVLLYQQHLRRFLKKAGINVDTLNPAGATGFYGTQTKALTRAAYLHLAKINPQWGRGDLTTPGPSLVSRIGLRVLR